MMQMTRLWSCLLLPCLLSAAACSSSSSGSRFGASGEDAGSSTPADGGPGFDLGADGSHSSDGCSDAARLVYLFTSDGKIHSLNPKTKALSYLSLLSCKSSIVSVPNSMAVDRDAVAWVNYSDGKIYRVQTSTGACISTAFAAPGWGRMGMGFSTEGTTKNETLYISDVEGLNGRGLASVGLPTMTLTSIGGFGPDVSGLTPELTGTGDGRLFGFSVSGGNVPAKLGQIDKSIGSASNVVSLSDIRNVTAWAFSFWGGDFYLYHSSSSASTATSRVTRYSPSSATSEIYINDLGIRVVGAGVSTCAPTTPQ